MFTKATITELGQLIRTGEAEASSLAAIPEGQALGLWTASPGGSRAVATPALAELLSRLPDEHEVLIGLASCQPKLRTAWQSIIAARLHEMGQRRDAESLCAAITELDRAAEAVRKLLPQARLVATGFGEWESQLFGCPAEQGPAFPKLLRAIGRTSAYVEGHAAPPVRSLPDINPLTPETNWVPNRLLHPPAESDHFSDGPTSVLTGSLADLLARESDATDSPGTARLRWVLYRPWALFLAQVVFTQEAWLYPGPTASASNLIFGVVGNVAAALRPPSLYLFQGNRLLGGFGDGKVWRSFSTPVRIGTIGWQNSSRRSSSQARLMRDTHCISR